MTTVLRSPRFAALLPGPQGNERGNGGEMSPLCDKDCRQGNRSPSPSETDFAAELTAGCSVLPRWSS